MLEGANAPLAFLLMGNDKGDRRFDSRLAAMVAEAGWRAPEWRNLTGGIVALHRATA